MRLGFSFTLRKPVNFNDQVSTQNTTNREALVNFQVAKLGAGGTFHLGLTEMIFSLFIHSVAAFLCLHVFLVYL